ncbi:hypothetical protein BU24DRAFT_184893 [Aaosphaeria arxii CBS 175.79]|uniref:Uncharacterized protein n=1 Tax=Aaosphaeria arxii CBS 175.79 TaxID=1450172 RepID=A0A6A5XSN5_9PLEO|nr:uncharacterized protein BU24DRAFT_184893 [Aaosphaeria arxii CBS 175.79]KAF2015761.1 hypothetical protein BU24DRAFT_184893 [Aaosphaeria arxii CBS 175.79]
MQFSTAIAALVLAAVGTQAAPVIEERQVNTIYARYFGGGGCQGPWLEDYVFVEGDNPTACVNNNLNLQYGSIFYDPHTTVRTLRVFNSPDCQETGTGVTFYDVKPTDVGCRAGQFKSYRFL